MEGQAHSTGVIDTNDLKSILRIVSKNWWIMASLVLVSFLIGYIYAYKLPDVFQASTKLLLQTNDKYNSSSLITSNSESFGYQTYIDNTNEINIIESYDLLKKVVDRIDVNVSYFVRGRLRTTEKYKENLPFKVDVYDLNSSLYELPISFKIIDKTHYEISYNVGKEVITRRGTFGNDLVNTDMKIKISKIGELNDSYISSLQLMDYSFQIHNPANLVYEFRGALQVTNAAYSNVLEITLNDILPLRAITFLDTLANLYIQNTLQNQFDLNTNTLRYIDTELAEVTTILNTIEDTMQRFKENKHILDLDREGQEYFSQYSKYDEEKANVEVEMGALDDLEKYIIQGKDSTFLPPSVYMSSDDFLRQGATTLYNYQISINGALNSMTKKNESIGDVKKSIKKLKENLLTYIGNSRAALQSQMANIDVQLGNYITKIKTLPAKQRGLMNIQRKQTINESLYEFLLQKRATTIIERAAIIPKTKVIETGRNIGVVLPHREKLYYIFMAVGALLALIIIFVRVTFYDRVENLQELKLKTSLPILGEILSAPLSSEMSIAVEDNPKSPLTESFRTLRTNLQYMAVDSSSKAILFTSNGPGEGKTFCSINLAAILAKAGKKVLLLEFDMHKPRIYKALGLKAERGISTFIIGKSAIDEVIQHTIIQGLDVMVCGPVPPNSSELVLSDKVSDILSYGRNNFDFVIIDTPPLGLISDAFILMRMADISLFVLNTKFAYKEAINYVQETVQINKIKNFGFVLNNVKRKKSKYYYNRYNYGYYGGYGYGTYGGYGGYGG
ncbi:MAG: polysaccharide biosynthesis tyrosine autokinase [Bacteroidia bacterium]|nr:polysaccharide biosynthesis tyrosine autokinase [Bacteroidia bacterium]